MPEGGERQWLVRSSLTGRGERRMEEEMFRHGQSCLGGRRAGLEARGGLKEGGGERLGYAILICMEMFGLVLEVWLPCQYIYHSVFQMVEWWWGEGNIDTGWWRKIGGWREE